MSVGSIFMSASTVVVALNAPLLRRLELRPEATTSAIARNVIRDVAVYVITAAER